MKTDHTVIHTSIKTTLHERAKACAEADGASFPEFVRNSIRNECRRIERNDRSFEEALDGIRREGL